MEKSMKTYRNRWISFFTIVSIVIACLVGLPQSTPVFAYTSGDEIEIKIATDAVTTTPYTNFYLLYDTDVFSYIESSLKGINDVSGATVEVLKFDVIFNATATSANGGEAFRSTHIMASRIHEKSGMRFTVVTNDTTGEIASLKLKVKDDIVIENELQYSLAAYCSGNNYEATVSTSPATIVLSSVSDPGNSDPQPSAYTVTADSTVTEIETGESFDVDVKLTANPAVDNWASLQADLIYDDDFVTPGTLPIEGNGVKVSKDDGQVRLSVSRTGDPTSVGESGVTVVSIPFTANAAGDAEFTIEDAKVSVTGQTEGMTAATAGPPLVIGITGASAPAKVTFDTDFAGAPEGFKLLKYALSEKPAVEYAYDGATMHYAYIGEAHYVTYIVENDVDATAAELLVAQTANTVTANDADINGDGDLEIVDAQIAYDLATAVFSDDTDFSALSIAQRLKADFDEDGEVTVEDAYAIQRVLHFGAGQ
jgi:hypothetical protein